MVVVRTVEEFCRKNEKELRKFIVSKTGIFEKQLVDDIVQEFYVRIIKSKNLEQYDENGAADFNTWIANALCWLLPLMRKKNQQITYHTIAAVPRRSKDNVKEYVDIWECLSKQDVGTEYSVAENYRTAQVEQNSADMVEKDYRSFMRFLAEKRKSKTLRLFLQYCQEGLSISEICGIMGVSYPVVRGYRLTAYRYYKLWKQMNVVA